LAAVEIMIMRTTGPSNELSNVLNDAARILVTRQSANAFFAHIAGLPPGDVAHKALAVCPKTATDIPTEKIQWIWERKQGPNAAYSDTAPQTMLWDCVFIANLLALPRTGPSGG